MPRVRDSREPELSPPRQYSGDDGLRPADCKDPWQPISALLGRVTWYPPFGVELRHYNSSRALARRHPLDKMFCIKKFDQAFGCKEDKGEKLNFTSGLRSHRESRAVFEDSQGSCGPMATRFSCYV